MIVLSFLLASAIVSIVIFHNSSMLRERNTSIAVFVFILICMLPGVIFHIIGIVSALAMLFVTVLIIYE